MALERDKYLAEAMRLCWHERLNSSDGGVRCIKCRRWFPDPDLDRFEQYPHYLRPKFSTWAGFGMLWEWAIEQDWWLTFLDKIPAMKTVSIESGLKSYISPNRFADALYEYLQENGNGHRS